MAACGKFSVRYTPEPMIIMFTFAIMLQSPIITQYAYKQFSEEKGLVYEYSQSTSSCGDHINITQQKIQDQVQSLQTVFNIGQGVCYASATMLACFFYGALSDKVGRRTIMLINCTATALDSTILLLVIFFKLPVYLFFLGAFIDGLGGAYNGMFMISFAYLADCTEKEKLPIRIAALEACNFVSACVSFFTSGPFIQKYGFIPPAILMVSLDVGAIAYVAIVLKESLHYNYSTDNQQKVSTIRESKLLEQPMILFKTLSKNRPRRKYLYLALVILVLGQCFANGLIEIVTLYFINRPFCWPALQIGNYLGTYLITMAAGTIIGLKVFGFCLPEYFVAAMSPIFAMGGYALIAFAKTKAMAYSALAVRGFGSMHTPIFRATISKVVDSTEQGTIFSIESILETFFVFVSGFIFNTTYSKLNEIGEDKIFFLIPAGLLSIQVFLTLFFWIKWRKESEPLVGEWSAIEGSTENTSQTEENSELRNP